MTTHRTQAQTDAGAFAAIPPQAMHVPFYYHDHNHQTETLQHGTLASLADSHGATPGFWTLALDALIDGIGAHGFDLAMLRADLAGSSDEYCGPWCGSVDCQHCL